MARTTIMRAQVGAANAMLDRIQIGIDTYRDEASAYPLSLDLSRLAAILRIHFSLADRTLYPFMIADGPPEAAAMARVFQREVNTLSSSLDRFHLRWPNSGAIAGDIAQFRNDATAMIMSIRRRLRRETRDLFPLADSLAEPVNDPGWSGDVRARRVG